MSHGQQRYEASAPEYQTSPLHGSRLSWLRDPDGLPRRDRPTGPPRSARPIPPPAGAPAGTRGTEPGRSGLSLFRPSHRRRPAPGRPAQRQKKSPLPAKDPAESLAKTALAGHKPPRSGGDAPDRRAEVIADLRSSSRKLGCGRSSGVEHNLAKVGVVGSNPIARSSFSKSSRSADQGVSREAPVLFSRREFSASFIKGPAGIAAGRPPLSHGARLRAATGGAECTLPAAPRKFAS